MQIMPSDESHYTDLFRFVTVRNPQLHEPEALRKRFVQLDITPAQLSALPDAATLLLTTVPAARAANNVNSIVTSVAIFYRNSPRRIETVSALVERFTTDFSPVEAWLRLTPHPTLAVLVAQLTAANIVPAKLVSSANFVDDRVTLWENLIAQYFQPLDAELREEVIKRLRWLWVLRRISDADPTLATEDDVRSAVRATALIPETMWPLPVPVPPPPPEDRRTTDRAAAGEPIGRKIVQHEQVLSEITAAYRQQDSRSRESARAAIGEGNPRPAGADRPIGVLSAAAIADLNPGTLITLRTLGLNPAIDPVALMRQRLSDEIRTAYGRFAAARPVTRSLFIGGGVIHLDEVCSPFADPDPCAKPQRRLPVPTGKGVVTTKGIGVLRVVRTELLKYAPGEIAHIENILVGETKKHTFRTLKRDEITDVQEEETTSEEEKDSQTTDRFELSQESSKVIKDDLKFDVGVTLSADLGSVKLGTSANFATSKSQETSDKLAVKQASEIVNKAVKRVVERRRHQRTTVSIVETDETDLHELKNTGAENVAGIYSWIDKYYLAKVYNYGRRLMLEFLVPEPAAFHIYRKTAKPPAEDAMVRPIAPVIAGPNSQPDDPRTWVPLSSFDLITADNVGAAAAPYDAVITASPAPEVTIGVAIKSPDSAAAPGDNPPPIPISVDVNSSLSVPPGYQATWATVQSESTVTVVPSQSGLDEWLNGKQPPTLESPDTAVVLVGNNRISMGPLGAHARWPMNSEVGIVPISVYVTSSHWVVNVEVQCACLLDHFVQWQIQSFAAIMAGYEAKMKQYRDWLAQQEARATSEADGSNADMNRDTEREELKRNAIEILTNQHFDAFDALTTDPVNLYPQIDIARARDEGRYVQFFEQAFEWHNMTYLFYPYFWNQKPNWIYIGNRKDADPLFTKFLQAGYARVVVPVRDSYRDALLHYLASPWGEIWNGGEVPAPKDPMYVSIVDEFKEENGDFTTARLEESFVVKMPTTLVMLQSIAKGLPDNSKELNWPPP
jgi:hypothetical protein